MTEEIVAPNIADGEIVGIQFGLATHNEIHKSAISDCPISHASQLANPFLGLPLEIGKCESCGTAEVGKCEGHFGYIELPIPVYHPSHVSELRRVLSVLCLKCLKLKTSKPVKNNGVLERLLTSCCEETCHVSVKESKNNDGASFLELRLPARYRAQNDCWNFLEKYGYSYGDGTSRTLLPSEVLLILRKLPDETRRKLARKGYFPQDGYILRYLPVPPNCLSVPDVSDGVSVMSSDLSAQMLKKVLRQIEIIRSSRSGEPNFESHEIEANELQIAVSQYLQVRGTGKASRDADNRYGVTKEGNNSSTKAWLEKMRTLFISKGSGFSSRSVITGDAYKPVNEIGLPSEIAQKMTFEERVNVHNIQYLQSLVDKNLCLTFRDGLSTYSLREGSKGHTFLRLGQIVHRRIMDGDIVFINRPPTTHKHSLQALRVYIHDGHTVKINPLMCGPLAADFDGDCVHLFYPQSLSARAEVVELFSVENQLLSSHSGNLNLQLATDSLLSLKTMFQRYFLNKPSAQQLAMYASTPLPSPAVLKACSFGPCWTAFQVLQTALPSQFECHGDRLLIRGSELIKLDFNRDAMSLVINEILTSLFFNKSPKEALNFFDSLQPLLMENLYAEGFSVGLHDFYVPISELQGLQSQIQDTSTLLMQLRSSFNELIQLQFETFMRQLKLPVANFILKSSALGNLIDSRSDSAIDKVVQQMGFLGLQLSDKRKFYSKGLVEEVGSLFRQKHPFVSLYPSKEYGLVKSCFFRGLDPYEEIVHSIATREVIVRSSKGLAEPGTLFKNLMAILRDVVICYDGSVRNISSNSVIQFEYGIGGLPSQCLFPAGEPVGVLAATAMSNPAYKAVLDSSPNSNSSWDMMKEILFCRVNFKNDLNDRRVILYLNDCECGRRNCQERASYLVKNHLQKVSLRDAAVEFLIEYKHSKVEPGTADLDTGLVGHIHLNKTRLSEANISMDEILQKCEDGVNLLRRKKKYGYHFRKIVLSVCDCCFFQHSSSKWSNTPCLKFFWQDFTDAHLEKVSHVMADLVCPVLLDTIIKGDPRISTVNIVWISPDSISWVQNPFSDGKGELGIEVTLEKTAVRQNGDAWRIILDCCLPIFHLIDTRRSIPYAIKQIQDLFGIACAFDQVVQRLSVSVSMVTKGVLKEHLILLASSMTCAGNLIGFNMSGIKALCRALSVQVPFTEATLYTPRKCFERASEKCHVDSLASIVASCSWGKRVAVGTGAKFDLLWDTKETGTGDYPVDVYNFLQLVRSSNEEEIDAGCLGEDIDKFDWEDAFIEPALSPEQENKAVFEDNIEVGLDSLVSGGGNSSWDIAGGNSGKEQSGGWSNRGPKKDQSQPEESTKSGGWDAPKSYNGSNATEPFSGWGKTVKETENAGSGKAESGGWSNWGPKKDQSLPEELSKSGGWDAPKSSNGYNATETPSAWGKPAKETDNACSGKADSGAWSNWGSKKDQSQPEELSKSGSWDTPKSNNGSKATEPSSAWGRPVKETESAGLQNDDSGWDNKAAKKTESSHWGQAEPGQQEPPNAWKKAGSVDGKQQTTWNSGVKSNNSTSYGGWDSAATDSVVASQWGQKTDLTSQENKLESSDCQREEGSKQSWDIASSDGVKWGQLSGTAWKKNSHESSSGWSSDKFNEEAGSRSWESKKGGRNSHDSAGGWGSPKVDQKAGFGGWQSEKKESKRPSSWGQQDGSSQKNSHEMGTQSWKAQKDEDNTESSWGKPTNSSWKNNRGVGSWKTDKTNEQAGSKSWESKKEENKTYSSWGKPSETASDNSTQTAGGWSSEKTNEEADPKSWGSKKEESKAHSSWGKSSETAWGNATQSSGGWSSGKANDESGSKGWEFKKKEIETQLSWGKSSDTSLNSAQNTSGDWSSEKPNEEGSGPWDSKKESKSQPSWGQPSDSTWKKTQSSDGWNSTGSNPPSSSQDWGSGKASSGDKNEKQDSWKQPSGSRWTKNSHESTRASDGSDEPQTPVGLQAWDSPKAGSEGELQSPWGQSGWKKRRPEGGRGWGSSNSGEWKSKRSRPPKQPGMSNDDSNSVALTATRKRMDIFTPEEQDALTELETIMQSIRRIMHQSGFNDGDPLPADDQSYIINNVLDHHPDKAAKIGSGVDYITVKKHSNFQDSRCFYVVSTDGRTEDFSYIKCLGNMIKGKYPSIAESFTSKYFGRPRGGGNRQQEQQSS